MLVEHAGQRRVLKTAPTSKYGMSCLAWFSDVTHQVQKVESGHRVVLTYNLVKKGAPCPLTAATVCKGGAIESELSAVLRRWQDQQNSCSSLVYKLEHEVS